MSFDSNDVENTAIGQIGLNGVTRWLFDEELSDPLGIVHTQLAVGDFSFYFNSSRKINGNSGWVFKNNVGFPRPVFNTRNVRIRFRRGKLKIRGDLYIAGDAGTVGVRDSFGENYALLTNIKVGRFNIKTRTQPMPEIPNPPTDPIPFPQFPLN